jgi:hypothetical protein
MLPQQYKSSACLIELIYKNILMNIQNKIFKNALLIVVITLAVVGCKKLDRPALGDYPQDKNPPGGPLKFYAALDGGSVDSIRANFATDNNVTYVTGINGKAVQFDKLKLGYIVYGSANDFGSQTNFSVSLWINPGTIALKDHVNANGIMAFGKSSDFWGNFTLFNDHENSTSDSMLLKAVIGGNFITYEGATRIPHMYDNNWHHLVFTYDATSATYIFYLDGKKYDQRNIPKVAFKDASVLVLGGFQQAASVQGTYKDNTWMSPFPGAIDQVRLYGTVLSSAEVTTLFTGKM